MAIPYDDRLEVVRASHGRNRARRGLLLSAAVGLLVGATACDGGDSGWKAPGKGQAAVLLDPGHSGALDLQGGGELEGLTIAEDGTVDVLRSGIQKIKSDRTVESLRPELTNGSSGLVALPDGSLVFGKDHAVHKVDRNQQVGILAGVPGKERSSTAQAPKSAVAAGFRFGDYDVAPLGVRADGSLILLDGDVVWALANGRLTRVYEVPAADRKARELDGYPKAAVDGKGTVYVTSGPRGSSARFSNIADIVAIRTDGTAAPVAVPQSVAGVKGKPGDLTVNSFTGDGADGIYVNAYGADGEYILHLHAGRADLVARSLFRQRTSKSAGVCPLKRAVDAEKLTFDLAYTVAYGDGKLILGGNTEYLLQIGIK
ncbi:hypothetical protein [Streptomyces sp. HUAS TT20]|uniref:hypothetical protein n=1 Tax=Streptomyces sp. HUAS TT20 TaxID=3447509 RepID=UPI0021DA72D0|nr:hypothetical protein [Streptomyces sp. HUAS 15-9]UXY29170.1 hypothetical protein N8I87_23190 [Streptomyces sp. HUAS 15-9]